MTIRNRIFSYVLHKVSEFFADFDTQPDYPDLSGIRPNKSWNIRKKCDNCGATQLRLKIHTNKELKITRVKQYTCVKCGNRYTYINLTGFRLVQRLKL